MPPHAWRRNDRQPLFACPAPGKPALKTTTIHHPNKPESQHKPFSISLPRTACAERRRRQGPAAATRSGSAQALTPTPTSTRPAGTRNLAKQAKTTQPLALTGPTPSGMTCGDARGLTTCHRGFVSNSCHFFSANQLAADAAPRPLASSRLAYAPLRHVTSLAIRRCREGNSCGPSDRRNRVRAG